MRALRPFAALAVIALTSLVFALGVRPTDEAASTDGPGRRMTPLPSPHIPYAGAPHAPYRSVPPTSGPHVPQTVAPGVYDRPIPDEIGVHALEHGHVLIHYAPGTPEREVAELEATARRHPRDVVLAPHPELARGIALTAWGRLLRLAGPDPRVEAFVAAHARAYQHGWKHPGRWGTRAASHGTSGDSGGRT